MKRREFLAALTGAPIAAAVTPVNPHLPAVYVRAVNGHGDSGAWVPAFADCLSVALENHREGFAKNISEQMDLLKWARED